MKVCGIFLTEIPIFDFGILEIDLENGSQNRENKKKPDNPHVKLLQHPGLVL
jgi:hypothetical protein